MSKNKYLDIFEISQIIYENEIDKFQNVLLSIKTVYIEFWRLVSKKIFY